MKRKLLLTGNIIGAILVISFFFSARFIFSSILQDISNSSGTGIIGGSDGPTAVFLSGPTNLNIGILFLLPTLFVGMLLILNIVYLVRNR
ncbi:hypothetical protein [Marinilabilia sp.]|uniref:hypothetical protein n=1 Tax=Marinilabilia sp. TaxID=2021252 RepID=UPI0025BE174F|nr:hypothetical protein [Marinilabilia sp.]